MTTSISTIVVDSFNSFTIDIAGKKVPTEGLYNRMSHNFSPEDKSFASTYLRAF